ncbi:hypothetical protein M3201_25075 [Paenibacillus motobuensis]|uniref:hypothetical protein n=1 Tax=Paenibacillus TaxID=44249 RepID=UPI00203B7780|nr:MULTISPECIES: hypothetical protein [Paenibacillus]MCM3042935.1 hypothetical protein [Paenibacillus lutimineralis]MCM3650039.1 hypothetical protein [Paenibacillus motobuensis]
MKSKIKSALIFIIILIIAFLLDVYCSESDISYFNKKINSMGGVVIDVERHIFDNGPFWYREKNRDIYEITYKIHGVKKTAWVKKGTFEEDWRWNE